MVFDLGVGESESLSEKMYLFFAFLNLGLGGSDWNAICFFFVFVGNLGLEGK